MQACKDAIYWYYLFTIIVFLRSIFYIGRYWIFCKLIFSVFYISITFEVILKNTILSTIKINLEQI